MHILCKGVKTLCLFCIELSEVFTIFLNRFITLARGELMEDHPVFTGVDPCPVQEGQVFFQDLLFLRQFIKSR